MKRDVKLLFTLVFVFPLLARADVSVSPHAKVYKDGEGLTMTLVPFRPASERTALIKFSGVEHAVDGLVFLYQLKKLDRKDVDKLKHIQTRRITR